MNTHWTSLNLITAFGIIMTFVLITSCATAPQSGQTQGDYTPTVNVIPSGYRPHLPFYNAEVTYQRCQDLSEKELADIHAHFAMPLIGGLYHSHIDSIVVYGSYEPVQTRFGIWLHDGRHLDSGSLFLETPGFSNDNLGRPMHRHATMLLRKAIPDSKLERDKQARLSAAGQGR
jgi:hypothetical protein